MDLSMAGCNKRAAEAAEDLSSPTVKKANIDNKQEVGDLEVLTRNGSTKVAKGEVNNANDDTSGGQAFKDLSGFKLTSVLSNSADAKRLIVQGTFADGEVGVVILDKKPFSEENFKELFSNESKLNRIFQNDIYGNYDCVPGEQAAAIKATIVHPATEKHIEKYIHHELFLVNETPVIYEKVVLPHLESTQFNIQWVFNILEHKKEADRIVYEDSDPKSGFVLLPDLKWDGKSVENLYLCAIVHAKGIKSLRDLSTDHLPLLKNVLEKGSNAIKEKYGLSGSQLRIYLHYQPSYYHLHVHFTALNFNAPGIYTEKSHLLQTVIANIESQPNYYSEATLPFVVKKNDPLYTKLVDFGYKF